MELSFFKQAAAYLRKQRNDHRWRFVVTCLALAVILGTVLVMKLPGQAQSHQVKQLNCQLEVHTHEDSCYDEEGNLICGEADFVVHQHNEDCYDASGALVCTLEEIEEHEHSEECLAPLTYQICGQAESEGHTHGDSCYEQQLTCGQAESEEHTHDDSCYATVLTCTQEESEGHTHSDSCYNTVDVISCGKIEAVLHTHDESCYDEDGNRICDTLEVLQHVHSDAEGCFETVELSDEQVASLNDQTTLGEVSSADASAETEPDAELQPVEGDVYDETVTYSKEYVGSDYTVTVTYDATAEIPEEAEFTAEELLPGTEGYDSYYAQLADYLLDGESLNEGETLEQRLELNYLRLFDMKFTLNGEEIEPAAAVQVQITYADAVDSAYNSYVHFGESGTESLPVDVSDDGTQITVVQDSFSVIGSIGGSVATTAATDASSTTSSLTAGDTLFLVYTYNNSNYTLSATSSGTLTGAKYNEDDTYQMWTVQSDGTLKNEGTDTYLLINSSGVSLSTSGSKILYSSSKQIYSTYGTGTSAYARGIQMYLSSSDTSSVGTLVGFSTSAAGTTTAPGSGSTAFTLYQASTKRYTSEKTTKLTASGETATLDVSELSFVSTTAGSTQITSINGWSWSGAEPSIDGTTLTLSNVTATTTVTGTYSTGSGSSKVTYTLTWTVTIPTPATVTYVVSHYFTNTSTSSGTSLATSYVSDWYYGDDSGLRNVRKAANAEETYIIGVTGLDAVSADSSGDFNYIEELADGSGYIVKAPSSNIRIGYGTNDQSKGYHLGAYTFTGWKGSDGKTYQAGDVINVSSKLTLTALWSGTVKTNVSFYINLGSNDGGMTFNGDSKYWTDALVAVGATITTESLSTGTLYGIDYSTTKSYTSTDLTPYDQYIRENAKLGITGNRGSDNSSMTLTMTTFPTDAEIFARIQTWGKRAATSDTSNTSRTTISVNGVDVPLEDITEKNYSILWVKVLYSETWHVDGILVPKDGTLKVTKSFVGLTEDQIKELANSYYINVTKSDGTVTKLVLNQKTDTGNNTASSMGYSSYDAATKTYTWVLNNVTQLKDYTVEEFNYTYTDSTTNTTYVTSASYLVDDAENDANDTDGWVSGTKTGSFRCYSTSTAADAVTTVNLRNVYVKPWTMSIFKTDGTTSNPLSNVEFTLKVWKTSQDKTTETPVSTQIIKSDANGNIDFDFKALGEGSYAFSLEESNTTGYQTLGTFWGEASVSAAGAVQAKVTDITNIPNNTSVKVDDSGAIINVTNYSERAQMTVTKVWTDKTNKEVTIQLMRNGVLVNGMTKTLSASNNWTDTWTDLPLYVDGAKATYSVREIQIGKTGEGDTRQYNTTDDPTDGYADYIVTVSGTTQTVDSNKNVSYSVTVQNTKDNGQVVFTKVNGSGQALAGAEFTVYTDQDCTTVATITSGDETTNAVFTSDANGIVTIVGLEPNTYYVKETKAPSGYQPGDTVYILNAKANNSSLVDASGSKVNQVLNEPLEVALSLVKRATGSGETAPNLTGAEFDLYDAADYNDTTGLAANATAIEHITSEADAVKFTAKLGVGSYVLIETKAPEGYNLLTTAIHFSIDGEGKVIMDLDTAKAVQDTQDNSPIPYQWTITVYNTTGQTLPNTGGIGTTPLYAFGVTAIGAALLMFGLRKRSRERGVE